jgi:murein DD-endopeptidase MepM/ murein hydrolase activator NlpD
MKYLLIPILLLLTGCSIAQLPSDEEEKLNNDLSFLTTERTGVYYKVRQGDTLWKIAKMHNTDVNEVIQANRETLQGKNEIRTGQILFIPFIKDLTPPITPAESEFIWPLKGAVLEPISEEGINIKARQGESVRATKSGIVTYVDDKWLGLGKIVVIKHSDGFVSMYGYNSEILVKAGESVKQGQVIARAGKSGRAQDPQLHFKLMKNDKLVNPLSYLK